MIDSINLLKQYPLLENEINIRELELLIPYHEQDENIGGGKGNTIDRTTENIAVALAEDDELMELIKIKSAIDRCLRYCNIQSNVLFNFDTFIELLDKELEPLFEY